MLGPAILNLGTLTFQPQITVGDDSVPSPPTLHLTAEKIDSNGIYLMDDGSNLLIYVGHNINQRLAISMFGAPSFNSINPNMVRSLI